MKKHTRQSIQPQYTKPMDSECTQSQRPRRTPTDTSPAHTAEWSVQRIIWLEWSTCRIQRCKRNHSHWSIQCHRRLPDPDTLHNDATIPVNKCTAPSAKESGITSCRRASNACTISMQIVALCTLKRTLPVPRPHVRTRRTGGRTRNACSIGVRQT
jgi:hypothetical protein